jgi:hypothetical protein
MRHAKLSTAALCVLLGLSLPTFAGAGNPAKDRIHADAYGNLVIHSSAGFKRILVGQGHLLRDYAEAGPGPRVVYLDDEAYRVRNVYRCIPQPAIVHGRSYMYGLPEGVVPVIAGGCR